MKITILQENLVKGTSIVSRIVADKVANPMEHCLQLKTQGDMIRLATMNSQLIVNYFINGKVDEQGTVLLPALYFSEFVNTLPGGVSVFLSTTNKSSLRIDCDRSEARFSLRSEEITFPEIPEIKATTKFSVDIKELRAAVKLISFSAAKDRSRPLLAGINFRIEGQEATMATTDGFRLSIYKIPLLEPVEKKISVTIPANSLIDLIKIANDYDGAILIELDSTRAVFTTPIFKVSSNIIAGAYPNYEIALPKTYKIKAVANTEELYPACRIANIFSQENREAVDLTITDGAINLSTGKQEQEQAAMFDNTGSVTAVTEGQGTIHLDSRYLLEIVELLKGSQIEISTETIISPVKIIPVGINNYMTHILMPIIKSLATRKS